MYWSGGIFRSIRTVSVGWTRKEWPKIINQLTYNIVLQRNPFVICKTNLLQKKINMLLAGLGSVPIVKSYDLRLENAALGPPSVFQYINLPGGK